MVGHLRLRHNLAKSVNLGGFVRYWSIFIQA